MMANERPSLGFGDELETFDPAQWAKTKEPAKPAPEMKAATEQVAAALGFKSREPQAAAIVKTEQKFVDRRRRTGRNAQLNLKAKPETIEAFYKFADSNGLGLGEAFEKAVRLLQSENALVG
jgi:hypothetical protein